jgi:polysaccharide biosynthesis protein PslG
METLSAQLSRALVLLAAAVAICLALVPAARAAQPGVVSDLTWYISDGDKQKTVSALQDLGSDWTRLAIQWREAEPSQGKYNEWWLNEYEKAIDMARAGGQRVIVMVDSAPAWASGSTSSNAPRDPAQFAAFMSFIAKRYAGKVDAWEIWNEQNLQRFWSTGPDPKAYAALLRAAYPAVKAADPGAKVVYGGTASNDYAFLEGVYAAGGKGYFDVLGTHPYTYCGSTSPEEIRMNGSRISRDSFLGYRELRKTMEAQGDVKPIWATEMGWTTASGTCNPGAGQWQGGVPEQVQAENLYKAYKLLEADPYVEVALWYNVRNNYWLKDEDQAEARYGLMTTDFTPKPAYGAFKAYAHGESYATTPAPTPAPPKGKKKTTRTVLQLDRQQSPIPTAAEGKVAQAEQGAVLVVVQAHKGKGWHTIRRKNVKVNQVGQYRTRLRHLPRGKRIRARAIFRGTRESRPSRSRYVKAAIGAGVKQRRR